MVVECDVRLLNNCDYYIIMSNCVKNDAVVSCQKYSEIEREKYHRMICHVRGLVMLCNALL